MNVKILFEDKDIIVVVKPSGMPSQGDKSMTMDMVSYLKNYLAAAGGQRRQGEPYVGVVHRLDRPVGGVMVYAKTPEAAKQLSRQIQENKVKKKYMALLTGLLPQKEGHLVNWLLKDGRTNTSSIVPEKIAGAKRAELLYKVLRTRYVDGMQYSLVQIELLTGRHHQIRVQTAGAGAGIYGDTKYNPEFQGKKGWFDMGLFSCFLGFYHPRTKKQLCFEAVPEAACFKLAEAVKSAEGK